MRNYLGLIFLLADGYKGKKRRKTWEFHDN